jgi:Fe-S cluster biosynthesis and repair protein YggX
MIKIKKLIFKELGITLTTRWASDQIKLISDPNRLSTVNLDAKNTFIEQQKWFLFSKQRLLISYFILKI